MGSLNNQQGGVNDAELARWDPRKEDYLNCQSSTSHGSNFTRSNNLARNKEVVWEPRGLYVRNIPLSISEESLFKIFSAHGKVLSVYIGKPRSDFAAADVTWGIVKVESMRDALAMITELNLKSPLKLKVELSLSEEERLKRRQEKEMERNAQKEMETCVSNRLCPEDLKQMMPVSKLHEFPASSDSGIGRGKMLASLTRENDTRSVGGNYQMYSGDEKVHKDSRFQSSVSPTSAGRLKEKPKEKVAVEINVGCVSVGWRKPRPCVAEGCSSVGKLRCSVCKAFYCSKVCQIDDWFSHSKSCRKPPPLENFDGISSETSEDCTALPKPLQKDSVVEANSKMEKRVCSGINNNEPPTWENEVPKTGSLRLSESKEVNDKAISGLSSNRNAEAVSLHCESRQKFCGDKSVICKGPNLAENKNFLLDQGKGRFMGGNQNNLRKPFPSEENKTVGSRMKEQNQVQANNQTMNTHVSGKASKVSINRRPDSVNKVPPIMNKVENKLVSTANPSTTSSTWKATAAILNTETVSRSLTKSSSGTAIKDAKETDGPMLEFKELHCIFDNIELDSLLLGLVTTKESCKNFMLLTMTESASYLLTEAPAILESSSLRLNFEAVVGSLIAAKSVADGSWYRAYVYGKKNELFSVIYIDFGNCENVLEIKPLPPGKLSTLPGLAVVATFHGELSNNTQKLLEDTVVVDEQLTFKVTGKKPRAVKVALLHSDDSHLCNYILRPWYLALPYNDDTIASNETNPLKNENVIDEEIITSPDHIICDDISKFKTVSQHVKESSSAKPDALKSHAVGHTKKEIATVGKNGQEKFWYRDLHSISLEKDKDYNVIPVEVGENNILYVHCLGLIDEEIQEMCSVISNHCEKAETPSSLEVGELVCGYRESGDTWYRSEVKNIKNDEIAVHFVDFGSSHVISRSNVRVFKAELMKTPVVALKVKLARVDANDVEMKRYLVSLVMGEKTYKMRSLKGDGSQFELFDNGVLLNDRMCSHLQVRRIENSSKSSFGMEKEALATKDGKSKLPGECELPGKSIPMYENCKMSPLKEGKAVEIVVIHASRPHAIYIVAKTAIWLYEDLEKMSGLMTQYCESYVGSCYEPRQGEMCLAKFSEDGLWYRAACIEPRLTSRLWWCLWTMEI
ncbi:tudor domain-containing protein 1-like [Macrobrachium rosenbergii]|uniref:tudor domain-containing protein 1-like n=1 Tax=Macrobrachium rosenbergii TaxID=79674 RepID=UPI0034D68F63